MKDNQKYICVMLPYPSGSKLHVGHCYNYGIMDSYARWQRYKGIEIFQPFGYDSFGLPNENYANKVGRNVKEVTYENINNFRKQMVEMNTMYEELLITSDESYYKWTQWLFLKLKEHGLAYKSDASVNYCNSCETGIANSEVIENKCERCGTEIEMKELEGQWFFKITDYRERLYNGLDNVDYPESTKKQQRHWLEEGKFKDWCVSRQRKWGCPIPIEGEEDTLDTFVCSSFYFVRYLDPTNENELISKDKYKQVDLYVGGREHACMHLIYSRFINMFLYDIGIVKEEEPYKRLIHQGMITMNGEKMSKTKGNVVNPDDHDPDELRMYLMFIGHYFDGGDWDDSKIKGIRRFIGWMKRFEESASDDGEDIDLTEFTKTIDYYTEKFQFNKVVSTFMEFRGKNKNKIPNKETVRELIKIFKCFAPNYSI